MARSNTSLDSSEIAALEADAAASAAAAKAGGGVFAFAVFTALLWVAGAAAFGIGYVGIDALRAMEPVLLAGVCVLAVLPAFLILFSGAAAREGARARAEARRLADAAESLFNPAPGAEAAARRLGVSVRGEIAALERAIDQALHKAHDVETLIAKQTLNIDSAVSAAQAGAEQMVAGMERERGALMHIAEDLNSQAGMIGDSISRHTRLIADAARLAESEIRAADEALDARLSSFGAAAALISDRTGALTHAAQASAESALRLESVLGGALDALRKATDLTDAARQSAEAATFAANNTAGAVRETTGRAVEDAKRAADMIRSEAVAVEREAAAALERLRETAAAARDAAEGARRATGAPAPQQEAHRAAPPQPAPQPAPSTAARRQDALRQNEFEQQRRPEAAPPRSSEFGFSETLAGVPPARANPTPSNTEDTARWTWREVLAAIDEPGAQQQQAPQRAAQPAERRRAEALPDERARNPLPAVGLIESAGLRLGEVFNLSTLDRIAQRSRNGTQARRRAVRDAAPEAVRRMADYLDRDQASRSEAADFMRQEGARIAELLGRGRASMSADATRAFLLLDAASA